jgi:hypothetical protein
MSTIKATHIQHPSAASPNFTLASDGTVSGGAGLGGLVHIYSSAVPAGTTLFSVDDVFDSTYDNYRIIIYSRLNASGQQMHIRWRVGGVNNSTASSYTYQELYAYGTSVAATQTSYTSSKIGAIHADARTGFSIDVLGPALADNTIYTSLNIYGSGGGVSMFQAGTHNQLTAYDGFTIFPLSGTFEGTVSVYGYANS